MVKTPGVHPLRAARDQRNLTQKRLAEETHVGTQTILRAEHNKPINADSRRLLCEYFKMTAEELGLLSIDDNVGAKEPIEAKTEREIGKLPTEQLTTLSQVIAHGIILSVQELENRHTSLQRVEVPATALVTFPRDLVGQPLWTRLSQALNSAPQIDEMSLFHLELLTQDCWHLLPDAVGVSSYGLLTYVQERLYSVIQLLEGSLPLPIRKRLASSASELAQIIGEIFFDLKDNHSAKKYYDVAIEAAQIAQNDILHAAALGRKSFIPIYSADARDALPLLQAASDLTTSTYTPIATSAWLAAIEAEAQANINDEMATLKALERSERFIEQGEMFASQQAGNEQAYTSFNSSVLLGYKGVCYIKLKKPEEAQEALRQALSNMDTKRIRHKSILFTDMAITYVQQKEIEEACAWIERALAIIMQTKSARVFQRIYKVRAQLEPWQTNPVVKHMDERIAVLRASFTPQK